MGATAANDHVPGWRRRKELRRPEILAAARACLEADGASSALMAEAGRRAGISEATVYKYFANRQDLVSSVLHEWMDPSIEALERDMLRVTGIRSRLLVVGVRHLEKMRAHPQLHLLVYRDLRWEGKKSELRALNKRYTRIVVDAVEQAIVAGEVRADVSPRLVRDMLFGTLEHVGLPLLGGDDRLDPGVSAAAIVDHLLLGIENSDPFAQEATRLPVLVDRLEAIAERLDRAARFPHPER